MLVVNTSGGTLGGGDVLAMSSGTCDISGCFLSITGGTCDTVSIAISSGAYSSGVGGPVTISICSGNSGTGGYMSLASGDTISSCFINLTIVLVVLFCT